MTQPRTALPIDDNLLSSVRVANGLKRADYHVRTVRAVPNDDSAPSLVLINLGSRPLNGVELIAPCRERFPDARVVGFCGHLEVEIRRAAKAAGIERILTNDEALNEAEKLG